MAEITSNPYKRNLDPADPDYYDHEAPSATPLTYTESLPARAEQMWNGFLGVRAARYFGDQVLNSEGEKVSFRELNRMFPNVEKPFTEDATFTYAKAVADRQKYESDLAQVSSRGPHGFLATGGDFVIGGAMSLADPVELSLNLAGFGLAERTFQATRLLRMAQMGRIGAATAVGGEAALGVMATQAMSQPLRATFDENDHREYDFGHEAVQAVKSGLFFGLMGAGAGALMHARVRARAADFAGRMEHDAAIALLLDQNPRLAETFGAIGAPVPPSEAFFRSPPPITSRERVAMPPEWPPNAGNGAIPRAPGRPFETIRTAGSVLEHQSMGGKFFAPSLDQAATLAEGRGATIDGNYGRGTYITTSSEAAREAAIRWEKNKAFGGSVHQVDVNTHDLKLLPIDVKPEGEMRTYLEGAVRKALPAERAEQLLEGSTTREIIDTLDGVSGLRQTVADRVNDMASAAGYDGLTYAVDTGRLEVGKHNVMVLFEHFNDKPLRDTGYPGLIESGVEPVNNKSARAYAKEIQTRLAREAEKAKSIQNWVDYNKESDDLMNEMMAFGDLDKLDQGASVVPGDIRRSFDEIMKGYRPEITSQDLLPIKAETQAVVQEVKLLEQQQVLPSPVLRKIETILETAKESEMSEVLAKNAIACMNGGV